MAGFAIGSRGQGWLFFGRPKGGDAKCWRCAFTVSLFACQFLQVTKRVKGDAMMEGYPTDDELERAAIAARDWKLHGTRECFSNYFNEDGFG